MKHNPNGLILWEGASSIDGAPIVVIATGFANDSLNIKTGAQIQTWILRADVAPNEAVRTGDDKSVCGLCPHRPLIAPAVGAPLCYVLTWQAPSKIWGSYKAGRYKRGNPLFLPGRIGERDWRFGAYGDPAAAPFWLWDAIALQARSVTGYTHQWRDCDPAFSSICMASVDDELEMREAMSKGWRTFRVAQPGSAPTPAEAHCQASAEMGAKVQCADCRACGGTSSKARCGIMIWDHSSAGRVQRLRLA